MGKTNLSDGPGLATLNNFSGAWADSGQGSGPDSGVINLLWHAAVGGSISISLLGYRASNESEDGGSRVLHFD